MSYINDFSILVTSISAVKNYRLLESILKDLFLLAENKAVQFNAGKTELIHFHTKRQPIEESITIGSLEVKPATKPIRWLGIYLDRKLDFKAHVEIKINAATGAYFGLQRLSTTQKGLSFRALRQLYIACITTIADFGVQLWWKGPGQRQQKLVQKFQKLQNLATKQMLRAFRGSPFKALEIEAAIPPPEVRFEKACNSYSLRILLFQKDYPVKQAIYS